MSVEIAWKQNNLVTDFHLLKLLQVVFGLGLQVFVCDFSRQNICSVYEPKNQQTHRNLKNSHFHRKLKANVSQENRVLIMPCLKTILIIFFALEHSAFKTTHLKVS